MTNSTGLWTKGEMDIASKEIYGRKASVAIQHRVCVSCKEKAPRSSFKDDEAYKEYLQCGLCQVCEDECMIV